MMELAGRIEQLDGPDRALFNKLDRSGSCWLWTGALDERGRGRVWVRGKIKLHHRAIWEILVGEIPEGTLLCHHCDNPTCANPIHMYVGDHKSNVDDMVSRGRHWLQKNPEKATIGNLDNTWSRGMKNPKAKLTEKQAGEIRASVEKTKVLADIYAVHRTTIQRIRRGANWSQPSPSAPQHYGLGSE